MLDHVEQPRKAARDVVEHAIEHEQKPAPVQRGEQAIKVGIVAEAGIDTKMIDRVVAMGFGRENWTECEARAARARPCS